MFDKANNRLFLSAQQKEGPAGDFQWKDGKGQPMVTNSFQMRVGSLPIITLSVFFFNQKVCYCNNQKTCLYDYFKKLKTIIKIIIQQKKTLYLWWWVMPVIPAQNMVMQGVC